MFLQLIIGETPMINGRFGGNSHEMVRKKWIVWRYCKNKENLVNRLTGHGCTCEDMNPLKRWVPCELRSYDYFGINFYIFKSLLLCRKLPLFIHESMFSLDTVYLYSYHIYLWRLAIYHLFFPQDTRPWKRHRMLNHSFFREGIHPLPYKRFALVGCLRRKAPRILPQLVSQELEFWTTRGERDREQNAFPFITFTQEGNVV